MMKPRRPSIWPVLWCCQVLSACTVHAQSAAVTQGHQLANQMCAQCHRVAGEGPGSWTDAPAFDHIASTTRMDERQLAIFIIKPHFDMVARDVTQTQANEIAAYILSLKSDH